MKQNNDHIHSEINALEQDLAGHVSEIRAQQLTEEDYQTMQKNLQKVIFAHGEREASSVEFCKPRKTGALEKIQAFLSPALNFKVVGLTSSMGAVLAVVLTALLFSAPTNTAFAVVLNKMQAATSMFYSSQIKNNGQHLMDVKVYYREPGQLRVETLPLGNAQDGALINVMDLNAGKGVLFFPGPKFATPFNFDNTQKHSANDDPLYWYQQLKNYQGEPAEYLTAKIINGVLADGFVIKQSGVTTTVWADVNSHFPVKLIVTLDKVNDQIPFELVADLEYERKFDNSLFSLEITSDYNISGEDSENH